MGECREPPSSLSFKDIIYTQHSKAENMGSGPDLLCVNHASLLLPRQWPSCSHEPFHQIPLPLSCGCHNFPFIPWETSTPLYLWPPGCAAPPPPALVLTAASIAHWLENLHLNLARSQSRRDADHSSMDLSSVCFQWEGLMSHDVSGLFPILPACFTDGLSHSYTTLSLSLCLRELPKMTSEFFL